MKIVCILDGTSYPGLTELSDHFKAAHEPLPYDVLFTCPYDGQQFRNDFNAFKSHMGTAHKYKTVFINVPIGIRPCFQFILSLSTLQSLIPEIVGKKSLWVWWYRAVVAYSWDGNPANLPPTEDLRPRGSFAIDFWSKFKVPPTGNDAEPDQRDSLWDIPYPTLLDGFKNHFDLSIYFGYPPPTEKVPVEKSIGHIGGSFSSNFFTLGVSLVNVYLEVYCSVP